MALQAAMKAEWSALSDAARITSSLCQKLDALNVPTPRHPLPHNIDSLIPDLVLSIPSEIFAPLATLQIPETLRDLLTQRLNRFIVDTQEQYRSIYRHTCLETIRGTNSTSDIDSIHQTYQALSERQFLPTVKGQVAFILAEVAKRQSPVRGDKRPFNNDFIPALETYFELNGYPTALHRSILAQKAGMTPRQIEVWFQNHRKRAREDGKIVHRLESDLPLKRALSGLADLPQLKCIQHLRSPTPSDIMNDTSDDESASHDQQVSKRRKLASCLEETDKTHEDDRFRPPHAFPVTSNSQYDDPFPNVRIFRFPPPIWGRKPATTPIIPIEVDMDDFARTFHMKLDFRSSSWKRECTPSKSDIPPFTPWFSPSRTIPPSAPLPALVRIPAPPQKPLPITPPSNPVIFDFNAKSKTSPLFSIVTIPYGVVPPVSTDLLAPTSETPRRNISPLPRRALNGPTSSVSPNANLLTPPGETPRRKVSPLPRRAPTKSQSFGSRTSSFGSDISYTSSSSDDSSPSPSTPPPLPDQPLLSEFEIMPQSGEPTSSLDDFSQFFDFSPQTFDFTFSKSSNDQTSSLFHSPDPFFQGYTPLIPTS